MQKFKIKIRMDKCYTTALTRCPFHFDFVRHPLKNTPSDPLGFSFFLTLLLHNFKH